MRAILVLLALPTLLAVSPELCKFSDLRSCVSKNDLSNPLPQLAHIRCVWCTGPGQNHCTSLENVRDNENSFRNWVCSFVDPDRESRTPPRQVLTPRPVTDSDPYGGRMGGGGGGGGGGSGGGGGGSGKMMMPRGKMMTMPGKNMPGGKPMEGPFQHLIDNLKKKAPKPLQFLGGLAMGVLGHLAGIDPNKVVMGIDTVSSDLKNLFGNFKLTPDGLKNTVSNVANTIKDMSSVLNAAGLHDLAGKANKVAQIANKVEGWAVKANQIVYKGVNIYSELKQAMTDFKAGKYYEVGTDIGNIISIIHPKQPSASTGMALPPVSPPVNPPKAPTANAPAGAGKGATGMGKGATGMGKGATGMGKGGMGKTSGKHSSAGGH